MFTQKSVINHVRKFAAEVNLSGIHLKKIVLFGSYAKNKQHKWSDIDVAMVADEFTGVGFNDIGLFSKIQIRYPYYLIQPRTYNTKDFSSLKDPFVQEILKNGIVIEV